MIKRVIFSGLICLSIYALPQSGNAADANASNKVRVTIGAPVYVHHPDNRGGGKSWNEGWLNNEGLLADVTWTAYDIGANTKLRLGLTGGAFDNSVNKTSVFLGGTAEIESFVSKDVALSIGTYAGGITGYDYDVSPAIAPYVGASYAVTNEVEVGVRGFWLPSETLAGSSVSPSDAYVGAVTVGTRF